VPGGTHGSAFANQLFEQRLHSIGLRAKQWARYDLTLLGRCEVARQVMASCLVYHAQFVRVPDHLLRLITLSSERTSERTSESATCREAHTSCQPRHTPHKAHMGAAKPHIATHVSQNTIAGADKLSTLTLKKKKKTQYTNGARNRRAHRLAHNSASDTAPRRHGCIHTRHIHKTRPTFQTSSTIPVTKDQPKRLQMPGRTLFFFSFQGTQVTMSGVKQHAGTHQKVRQENGTT
jgi:hypothetical protein